MAQNEILGIDIGGTGIKMGLVAVATGELLTERYKELTPKPSTPKAVVNKIKDMMKSYFPGYRGLIGCGFPAIMKNGYSLSASNVDKGWLNFDVDGYMTKKIGMPCYIGNDADVAGLAEFTYGSGKDKGDGLHIFLTIGTGIGSAMFFNQQLIPNSELGHLKYKGESYELYAANSAREREKLSWKEWGKRFSEYLNHVELIFSPDSFLLGGGVSKNIDKFKAYLKTEIPVEAAELKNAAGVVGAALMASQKMAANIDR